MKKALVLLVLVSVMTATNILSFSDTILESIYVSIMGVQCNDYVVGEDGEVYVSIREVSEKIGLDYRVTNSVHFLSNETGDSTIQYANGDIYIGNVEAGKRQGTGTIYKLDGRQLYGIWDNDKLNGEGRSVEVNDGIYEGEFYLSFKHGRGTYHYTNGDKYKGEWKYGLREGDGIHWYSNGDRYVGAWEDGLYNGYGKLYVGKTVREGLFENGKYVRYMQDPGDN